MIVAKNFIRNATRCRGVNRLCNHHVRPNTNRAASVTAVVSGSKSSPSSHIDTVKPFSTARVHSTLSAESSEIEIGEHFRKKWDGLANGVPPTLNRVPALPIIGSVIPQHSGIPNIDPLVRGYDFWLAMREKYGEFYTFGSPAGGNPNCLYRTQFIINDPREMVKVVRAGGKYPSGVLEMLWVNRQWGQSRGLGTTEGLFGSGEEWKRIRSFLQTDLLHPEAARGYVPGIIEAAELASRGAAAASASDGGMNLYLSRCAFDMFSTMMMGEYTETADPATPTDPENERFVNGAVQGLGSAIEMLFSPYEYVAGNLLGVTTSKMRHTYEGFDAAWEVAQDKIQRFMERRERDRLTENERASYLSRALDRQLEDGSNVTVREVQELAFTGLFAAVDTTSSVLGWNLFHIARLPKVQERLHEEVLAAVRDAGCKGRLTADVLSKSNLPYLHALVRETHRLTPTGTIYLSKRVDSDDIEIHGHAMQKGDIVLLEGFNVGMDPKLVDEPLEFKPERWLQGAVEARKGTPSEVIDHPFLKDPFSQGARKCPGSRVATNEIHVLLSQLVLDWKITSPISSLKDIRYQQHTTVEPKLPAFDFETRK